MSLAHIFKLPYDVLVSAYYTLSKDVHVSWEAFNDMPWYFILMTIDAHKEFVDRQNDENNSQNDMFTQQQANMERMQKQQQMNMPKFDTPQLPNLNTNFNF